VSFADRALFAALQSRENTDRASVLSVIEFRVNPELPTSDIAIGPLWLTRRGFCSRAAIAVGTAYQAAGSSDYKCTSRLTVRAGVVLLMCRFLGRRDVGPSPRAHGRRRRSAKARSRGNWGRRVQRALWRFDRSAGVDCGLAIATDVHANTISARWTVGERLCEPPLGGFATPIGCFRPSRIVAGAGPADRRGQVASG
jgi:hypothetical protein